MRMFFRSITRKRKPTQEIEQCTGSLRQLKTFDNNRHKPQGVEVVSVHLPKRTRECLPFSGTGSCIQPAVRMDHLAHDDNLWRISLQVLQLRWNTISWLGYRPRFSCTMSLNNSGKCHHWGDSNVLVVNDKSSAVELVPLALNMIEYNVTKICCSACNQMWISLALPICFLSTTTQGVAINIHIAFTCWQMTSRGFLVQEKSGVGYHYAVNSRLSHSTHIFSASNHSFNTVQNDYELWRGACSITAQTYQPTTKLSLLPCLDTFARSRVDISYYWACWYWVSH